MRKEKVATCVLIWLLQSLFVSNFFVIRAITKPSLFPDVCFEEDVDNWSQTFFAITGEDSFLSACFFLPHQFSPFRVINFPLFDFLQTLFEICLSEPKPRRWFLPPHQQFHQPPSTFAITPSPNPPIITPVLFPRNLCVLL